MNESPAYQVLFFSLAANLILFVLMVMFATNAYWWKEQSERWQAMWFKAVGRDIYGNRVEEDKE